MQRRLTIASIIVLTLLLILPIALATVKDIVIKQDVSDTDEYFPTITNGWQIFRIPQKCKIEVVELYIRKNGSITGFTLGFYYWDKQHETLGSKIYEQNFTSIPTDYTKTNYTLSTPVQLNSSLLTYALYFKAYGGNTANDFIALKMSINNPYSDGLLWAANQSFSDWDLYFIFYGEILPDPPAIVYQWLPVMVTIVMLGIAMGMITKVVR